jgi:hypothetical protein
MRPGTFYRPVALPVLIPAAVDTSSAAFVAITSAAGAAPACTVGGAAVACQPLTSNLPGINQGLADRNLRLWRIRATGLAGDSAVTAVLTSADGVARASSRTLPSALPVEGLCVAAASCYYDFFDGGAQYTAALAASTPFPPHRFKLLVGDNLYIDVAPDKSARLDPVKETLDLYTRYFVQSPYRAVLERSPNFVTWDDHEFWNNYPEFQIHLRRTWGGDRGRYEAAARGCLALFQEPLNPAPVAPGAGRSYRIDVGSALSFFVADTRTERRPWQDGRTQMMTGEDLAALRSWASNLAGPGVLVVGQPMLLGTGNNMVDHNPADYSEQYQAIWRAVIEAPWDILIVSGDIHVSRLLAFDVPSVRPGQRATRLYEFVTSPAARIPTTSASVFHNLGFSRRGKQAEGSVRYPGRVDVGHPRLAAVEPRYEVGSDAANTFGLLNFRPAPGGAARVECAFWEMGNPGGVPPARAANGGQNQPTSTVCFLPTTIRLDRRG